MKTVIEFETGDILVFNKKIGCYDEGQIIILGEMNPNSFFTVLGDRVPENLIKLQHSVVSQSWLQTNFEHKDIEYVGKMSQGA